jgi:aldehyde dehydrogenase (NAD+)
VKIIEYDRLYIDGRWKEPAGDARITAHSATTEDVVGSVPEGCERDIDAAVEAARRAFDDPDGWSQWAPDRRAEVLGKFAAALEARAEETARRVTVQNGMLAEVAHMLEATFPALLLRYYAGLMMTEPQEEVRPGMLGGRTLIVREPIGVVAAIVPWNVPQSITAVKVAPALASGCTVVLKPAPETVLDAFLMAEAAAEAGLPAGVLNIVPGGRELGAYLVAHPRIDKVSFTGSSTAGRNVAESCGRLLRPVTLELGGKSAAVVLDDADLDANLASFSAATMFNNGQACWLGSRVLVPRGRYQEIVDTITDMAAAMIIGDPLDPKTQLGPLVSSRQRDRVEGYIARGKADGARLTTGGRRPAGFDRGWFVEPTVFADVDNKSVIAREEIFGPVLSVIPYITEDEAIAIANDTEYGLGGSVWTADPERGAAFARKVQTGTIGVNAYVNDPAAPFGGIKASGMGRELGPEGLLPFQVVKTVYLDTRA